MGYTVTVSVSGKTLREKALAFMQKQFRRWAELHPDFMESHSVGGPMPGPELSYDCKVTRIGFDYSCMPDLERHYIWCIINWMALTFGDRRKFKGSDTKYPFYIYDGYERYPVLVGDDWKNRPESLEHDTEHQSDGWYPWPFSDDPVRHGHWLAAIADYKVSPETCEKAIRAELKRLTAEWQKENDNGQAALHHRDPDVRVGK